MMHSLVPVGTKGRMTLTGHADEMFIRRDNPDGSILLQPAVVKTKLQDAYDTDAAFRTAINTAMHSPLVERQRPRRR